MVASRLPWMRAVDWPVLLPLTIKFTRVRVEAAPRGQSRIETGIPWTMDHRARR